MLGGGQGPLQGLHGLIIDNVVSLRVVLGNGSAISVSSNDNPDLFYAMRGAGQNFGVVSSAQIRTYSPTYEGKIQISRLTFKLSQAMHVLRILQEAIDLNAPELYILLSLDNGGVWNPSIYRYILSNL